MIVQDARRIGKTIGDGYLAEGIVQTLLRKGEISEDDEWKLQKAKNFMNNVNLGLEQAITAKLGYKAFESISSYSSALDIIQIESTNESQFKDEFEKKILEMQSKIDEIIKTRLVNVEKVEELKNFFLEISRRSLRTTQNIFEKRRVNLKMTKEND
ncbi:MAG: hypothetical protein C3F06_08730 [Candidatus Methanoperedenaceae archaeon]|nr:MAG: hypothetical protein C3F06_08730 [Candidatus Methanoperedenaceae archaeon]